MITRVYRDCAAHKPIMIAGWNLLSSAKAWSGFRTLAASPNLMASATWRERQITLGT
jgi:hypothetical protein